MSGAGASVVVRNAVLREFWAERIVSERVKWTFFWAEFVPWAGALCRGSLAFDELVADPDVRRGFQLCISRFDSDVLTVVEADSAFPPGHTIPQRLRAIVAHVRRNLASLLRHDAVDSCSSHNVRCGTLVSSDDRFCRAPPHPLSSASLDQAPILIGREQLLESMVDALRPRLQEQRCISELCTRLQEHANELDFAARTLPVLSADTAPAGCAAPELPLAARTDASGRVQLNTTRDGRLSLGCPARIERGTLPRGNDSQRLSEQLHAALGTLKSELSGLKAEFASSTPSPPAAAARDPATCSPWLPALDGGAPTPPLRVLCIVGPPGCGKSALAAGLAAACLADGSRGAVAPPGAPAPVPLWNAAFRVELRGATTADGVHTALAVALGLASAQRDSGLAFAWLALHRGTPMGLLLDNADGVERRQLVTLLRCALAAHPGVQVVVTSRRLLLRVRGRVGGVLVRPIHRRLSGGVAGPCVADGEGRRLAWYCGGLPSALKLAHCCLSHADLPGSRLLHKLDAAHALLRNSLSGAVRPEAMQQAVHATLVAAAVEYQPSTVRAALVALMLPEAVLPLPLALQLAHAAVGVVQSSSSQPSSAGARTATAGKPQTTWAIDDVDCLSPLQPDRDTAAQTTPQALGSLCCTRSAIDKSSTLTRPSKDPKPSSKMGAGPRGGDWDSTAAVAALDEALSTIDFVSPMAKHAVQQAVKLGLLEYVANAERVSMPRHVAACVQATALEEGAAAAVTAAAINVVLNFVANKLALAAKIVADAPCAALAAVDRDRALVTQMLRWAESAADARSAMPTLLLACWEGHSVLRHRLSAQEMDDWLRRCVTIARFSNSQRLFAQVMWRCVEHQGSNADSADSATRDQLLGLLQAAHGPDSLVSLEARLVNAVLQHSQPRAPADALPALRLLRDDLSARVEAYAAAGGSREPASHDGGGAAFGSAPHAQRLALLLADANEALAAAAPREAAELLTSALRLRSSHQGPRHPEALRVMHSLAAALEAGGHLARAELLLKREVEDRTSLVGGAHPDAVAAQHKLAGVLLKQRKLGEAQSLLQRALAAAQLNPTVTQPALAALHSLLGIVYNEQGVTTQAEERLWQAHALLRPLHAREHRVQLAACMHNLATILEKRQRLDAAEALHRRALALRRLLLGDSHPKVAASLAALGGLYAAGGLPAAAEASYRAALAAASNASGGGSAEVSSCQLALAAVLLETNKTQESAELSGSCLASRSATAGALHPSLAAPTCILGEARLRQRRWAEASQVLERAAALAAGGGLYALQAKALFLQSCARARLGDAEASRKLMHQSALVIQDAVGQGSSELADHLEAVAAYLTRGLKCSRALALLDHSVKTRREAATLAPSNAAVTRVLACRLLRVEALTRLWRLADAGDEVAKVLRALQELLARGGGLSKQPAMERIEAADLESLDDPLPSQLQLSGEEAKDLKLARFGVQREVAVTGRALLLVSQIRQAEGRQQDAHVAADSAVTCLEHAHGSGSNEAAEAALQALSLRIGVLFEAVGAPFAPGLPPDLAHELQRRLTHQALHAAGLAADAPASLLNAKLDVQMKDARFADRAAFAAAVADASAALAACHETLVTWNGEEHRASAQALMLKGRLAMLKGAAAEGVVHLEAAVNVLGLLPDSTQLLQAEALTCLAACQEALQQHDLAEGAWREAMTQLRGLPSSGTGSPLTLHARRWQSYVLFRLTALLDRRLFELDAAESGYRSCLVLLLSSDLGDEVAVGGVLMCIADVMCRRFSLAVQERTRVNDPPKTAVARPPTSDKASAGSLGRVFDPQLIRDAASGGAAAQNAVSAEVESLLWRAVGLLEKRTLGSELVAACLVQLSAFLQGGLFHRRTNVPAADGSEAAATPAAQQPSYERLCKSRALAERACKALGLPVNRIDSAESVDTDGSRDGFDGRRDVLVLALQRRAEALLGLAQCAESDVSTRADELAAHGDRAQTCSELWNLAVGTLRAACDVGFRAAALPPPAMDMIQGQLAALVQEPGPYTSAASPASCR